MTDVVQSIGDFLISQALWPLTGGVWHMPLAMIGTALVMRFMFRLHSAYAVLLSVCANLFSCIAFAAVIQLLLYAHFLDGSVQVSCAMGTVSASISYALIQTLFQALLFWMLSRVQHVSVRRLSLAALIGNLLAALLIIRHS